MNQNRVKLIQTLGELLIPLLGYFLWNWNFYFIALFYFLDLVANTFFVHFKLKKIDQKHEFDKSTILYFGYYLISFSAIFLIGIFISQKIIPNFDLKQQSIDFYFLKDMGIPQGFVLIPLVFYAAYMQYKMEFLLTKKFKHISKNELLRKQAFGNTITLASVGIAFGFCLIFKIPETLAVLVLIGTTSFYSFIAKRG